MHVFANPARFLSIARPLTPWLFWGGLLLPLIGTVAGLFYAPPDFLQGESVPQMCFHVPAAWLCRGGWAGLSLASTGRSVWRPLTARHARRHMDGPRGLFT